MRTKIFPLLVIGCFLVAGSTNASADLVPLDLQTQFDSNQPVDGSATPMTFNRYDGSQPMAEAQFTALSVVTVSFDAQQLIGSGLNWNLYASVSQFGYLSSQSLGSGAPINYFSGPTQMQTVPTIDGGTATATFVLGDVTTTYTDPAALTTFFEGTTPFSYIPAGNVSGSVDTEVYTLLGTVQPCTITASSSISLEYFADVPEPATLSLLLPAVVLGLGNRRLRGVWA